MIPSISLIMTVYNRSRYLRAAIESVLAQTHQDFELLIWDDGSTDDSVKIAHDYAQQSDRIRVIAAAHQGRGAALKGAIDATTGAYLGFIDSDDRLAPTALAETITVLMNHPTIGMVYTDYLVMDETDRIQGLGKSCAIPYAPERLLLHFITFHFRLLRRSIYNQLGGIDPSFEYAQDYDLCLRLSEVTQITHLQKPLYYYRNHSQSISTLKRIEQIRFSQNAVEQALTRRGLSEHYDFDVEIQGRFHLRPKTAFDPLAASLRSESPPQSSNPLPDIETILPGNPNPSFADLIALLTRYQMLPQLKRELLIDQAIASIECSVEDSTIAEQQSLTEQSISLATRSSRIQQFKQAKWGHNLESYFLHYKSKLDRVIYSLIQVKDPLVAQELYFRIQEGEQSFAEVARQYSQATTAEWGGVCGPIELGLVPPAIAHCLSKSRLGDLLVPMSLGEWTVILRLEKYIPDRFDEQIKQHLLDHSFESWVQAQLGHFQIRKYQIHPTAYGTSP